MVESTLPQQQQMGNRWKLGWILMNLRHKQLLRLGLFNSSPLSEHSINLLNKYSDSQCKILKGLPKQGKGYSSDLLILDFIGNK